MIPKSISLRGLEVFELIARTGSVARTAQATGLSQPTVSQQLRTLEEAMGRSLVDHSRRPMMLTPAGRVFFRRTEAALRQIRQARAEATVLRLDQLAELSVGIIDDFESEVTPRFVTTLAATLTECRFRLTTGLSHELAAMLMAGKLDVAIASSPEDGLAGTDEYPLLTDPFVLAVPADRRVDADDPIGSLSGLPFLRYDAGQMLGRQIGKELTRQGVELPDRFQIDSNPSILALVGAGAGWTITTPLSLARGARFADRIDVLPLPFAPFSRRISLFCDGAWIAAAAQDLASNFGALVTAHVIEPMVTARPWLKDLLVAAR